MAGSGKSKKATGDSAAGRGSLKFTDNVELVWNGKTN